LPRGGIPAGGGLGGGDADTASPFAVDVERPATNAAVDVMATMRSTEGRLTRTLVMKYLNPTVSRMPR
jgi:hypothetical protein